jgi:hypothetical protein
MYISDLYHEIFTPILSSSVSYLSLDPRFAGSNSTKDDRFLRAIKICSTTSFGGEVKPLVPYHKILHCVKDPFSMKEILVGKIHGHFLPNFLSFPTRCLCWLLSISRSWVPSMVYARLGTWVTSVGVIRNYLEQSTNSAITVIGAGWLPYLALNMLNSCTTGLATEPGWLSQYSVWLWTGRPGDRGSIPGRGKGFFL